MRGLLAPIQPEDFPIPMVMLPQLVIPLDADLMEAAYRNEVIEHGDWELLGGFTTALCYAVRYCQRMGCWMSFTIEMMLKAENITTGPQHNKREFNDWFCDMLSRGCRYGLVIMSGKAAMRMVRFDDDSNLLVASPDPKLLFVLTPLCIKLMEEAWVY